MFSHPQGPAIHSQTPGDVYASETFEVQHPQQLAVVIRQGAKSFLDVLPPHFINQSEQRIFFIAAGRLHAGSKLQQGPVLAPRRAAVMETNISRSLEDECGQRLEVIYLLLAQGLENAAKRFLRHVFCRRTVAQPARGKHAQTLPKAVI